MYEYMFCMEGKKNVKVAITWRFPMVSLLSSEAPALIDLCRHQWQPATLKTQSLSTGPLSSPTS